MIEGENFNKKEKWPPCCIVKESCFELFEDDDWFKKILSLPSQKMWLLGKHCAQAERETESG